MRIHKPDVLPRLCVPRPATRGAVSVVSFILHNAAGKARRVNKASCGRHPDRCIIVIYDRPDIYCYQIV